LWFQGFPTKKGLPLLGPWSTWDWRGPKFLWLTPKGPQIQVLPIGTYRKGHLKGNGLLRNLVGKTGQKFPGNFLGIFSIGLS